MKKKILYYALMTAFGVSTTVVFAQERGQNRRGGRGFGPSNPIIRVLDADHDGVISAKEIENAAAALKKLDKNKDGKLTREELSPFAGRGGRGRDRFGGGPGRGNFARRIMGFDENGDGKVTKGELPERMQRIMDRLDTNGDGALTKKEIEAGLSRFGRGGGRGGRGPGQGRPERRRDR